jgi:hypothetical protein
MAHLYTTDCVTDTGPGAGSLSVRLHGSSTRQLHLRPAATVVPNRNGPTRARGSSRRQRGSRRVCAGQCAMIAAIAVRNCSRSCGARGDKSCSSSAVTSPWKAVAARCTPVAVHGHSLGQAASLDPVHKAGERRLLDTEALCQFGHSPRALRHDAQELGLNGREVVALGDSRIEALHQAGKLDKAGGGVGRHIIATIVSSVNVTPLSAGLLQGRRLRVVVHGAIVQNADS